MPPDPPRWAESPQVAMLRHPYFQPSAAYALSHNKLINQWAAKEYETELHYNPTSSFQVKLLSVLTSTMANSMHYIVQESKKHPLDTITFSML